MTQAIQTREHAELGGVASELISRVLALNPKLVEGRVMTYGDPPYRRIDTPSHALCYVRVRAKRHAVRVDVSGLVGATSPPKRLLVPSAGGVTLMIRAGADAALAAEWLAGLVQ